MQVQKVRESKGVQSNYLETVASVTRRVFHLPPGGACGLQAEMRDWAQQHVTTERCSACDLDCEGLLERLSTPYQDDLEFADSLACAIAGQPTSYWQGAHMQRYELTLVYMMRQMMGALAKH